MTEQRHKNELEQVLRCFNRYSLALFSADPTECPRMISEAWIKTHAVMTNLGEGEAIISDYRSYQENFRSEATTLLTIGQKIGFWREPEDSNPSHYHFNFWQLIKRDFDALDFLTHTLEPLISLSSQYQRATTDSDRQRTKLRSKTSCAVKWQKDKTYFCAAHGEIRRLVGELESLFPDGVNPGPEVQAESFAIIITETAYGDQAMGSQLTLRDTQHVRNLDDEDHGTASHPSEPSRPEPLSKAKSSQSLDHLPSTVQYMKDLREARLAGSDSVDEHKDHLKGMLQIIMWGKNYPVTAEIEADQSRLYSSSQLDSEVSLERVKLWSPIAPDGEEYDLDDQINDLLSVLNRVDVFLEYKKAASPSTELLFEPKNMIFQIILAYELKLRFEQRIYRSFANMSDQSIAAMEIAHRWVQGIRLTAWNDDGFDIEMLVHVKQLEGLLRFAEVIQWPHPDELRSFIQRQSQTQCQTQILGGGGTQRLLNLMYGIVLPGASYVFTIMTALVAATPEITFLGEPMDTACGLIPHDRSYWRSKHVLGRVFGGMKNVESSNGWVGPCPLPSDNGDTVKPG
ncbi:hypothetical protein FSARC_7227 [Fusarium sarcochroum]|uniref:Uncharacterized protein n=1 Tax=Fusarium sarcochroum TaxID=1208366 RepID=A0A8H4TVP0_9HYPO|nr:hypothetical protein FSARC_7227 [Fusarium sarcochroum]